MLRKVTLYGRGIPAREAREDISKVMKDILAKFAILVEDADIKEVYRVSSDTRSPILIRLI